jgi:hypothetical protein
VIPAAAFLIGMDRIWPLSTARWSTSSSVAARQRLEDIAIDAPAADIQAISYNSCRNRHCPKSQGNARARWLAARSAELLLVPYFHIVFTLPHEVSAQVLQNERLLYDLLFRASAETLLEVARDPKHWEPTLDYSASCTPGDRTSSTTPTSIASCLAVASPDGSRGLAASSCFFLPVRVLSRVFRGKFIAELKRLLLQGKLQFHGSLKELAAPDHFPPFLRQLFSKDWVVYAKPPFGGAEYVLNYLTRYTHRVAISNHRLVPSRTIASPSDGTITRPAASRRS